MSTLAERIEKVIGNGLAGLGLCDCGDPTCDDGRELAAHLAAEVAREVQAELVTAWDMGHFLGTVLTYNAVGDILWERHHEVIRPDEYRKHRDARLVVTPHWDSNPHLAERIGGGA